MPREYIYLTQEDIDLIVNELRHNQIANSLGSSRDIDQELLAGMAEKIELELLINWETLSTRRRADQSSELKQLSKYLVDILLIQIDVAETPPKLEDFIKILAFSYVAEHGERTRQVAEKLSQRMSSSYPDEWEMRVLSKIYQMLIYLSRKDGWSDLEEVVRLIDSLRTEQSVYETTYLGGIQHTHAKANKAYEMAALYHLAKAIEVCATFQSTGNPGNADEEIDLQIDYAIEYCDKAGLSELNLLVRLIKVVLEKMVSNSIWAVGRRIGPNVSNFLESMRNASKPVMELLYPQRDAIVSQGLLNPAHRAIIVNLPTSSGKTLVAEFKILQALNQFENGWVVYVAPTRALVNQITKKLRTDLGRAPLDLKVVSMSGAIDVDGYEETMMDRGDFHVLVVTPEKLNLLIRRGIEQKLNRPLALAVIDEAHNLGDPSRGINLELLLSNIKQDCVNANFLLLTPFVPNSLEIAEWLDPEASNSISLSMNWWRPNDQIVGRVSLADAVEDEKIATEFYPMMTSNVRIDHDDKYKLGMTHIGRARSRFTDKYKVATLAGLQYQSEGQCLIIAGQPDHTYKIADMLIEHEQELSVTDPDIELIKRYITDELGADFPLVRYLDYGIGVHHSALPEELKVLMEMLMEKSKLKYLVATTTIAQGINFNTPSIFMASYKYPYGQKMPYADFWNLVGRSGRINQDAIGVVGITTASETDEQDVASYLSEAAHEVVSSLKTMVEGLTNLSEVLNLEKLYYRPEWSNFLQYIAHMYNQAENLAAFEAQLQRTLKRTLGYSQLNREAREYLAQGVRRYAQKLDTKRELSTLSDMTGFSPETIGRAIVKANEEGLSAQDWSANVLFSENSGSMKKLVNIMLSAPEIRNDLSKLMGDSPHLTEVKIANMISDWVDGKDLKSMSDKYFTTLPQRKQLTACVKSIHKYLVQSATWGVSAIQRIPNSGIDYENLSEIDKLKIYDLPAMIYYGVGTSEAIALRRNRLTRQASRALSSKARNDFGEGIHSISDGTIQSWVKDLSSQDWNVTANRNLSGEDNKRLWQLLNNDV